MMGYETGAIWQFQLGQRRANFYGTGNMLRWTGRGNIIKNPSYRNFIRVLTSRTCFVGQPWYFPKFIEVIMYIVSHFRKNRISGASVFKIRDYRYRYRLLRQNTDTSDKCPTDWSLLATNLRTWIDYALENNSAHVQINFCNWESTILFLSTHALKVTKIHGKIL